MATDPESQTNADPREYKSLMPTLQETLLSLFYLMSDPDWSRSVSSQNFDVQTADQVFEKDFQRKAL
jgi:hypothetical protein